MPTRIQWAEETWNPVYGCTKVSPGCAHCYAEREDLKYHGGAVPWDAQAQRQAGTLPVTLHPERLDKPLHWERPRRVFVNSMSDLFHGAVPEDFIKRVFDVMERAEQHQFIVLTKRPERALELERANPQTWWWPSNVWFVVSAENQRWADRRIAALESISAAVKGVSCEPLLGPINLRRWLEKTMRCEIHGRVPVSNWTTMKTCGLCMEKFELSADQAPALTRSVREAVLDWVIVGGESGGPEYRSLVRQNKQGEWEPVPDKVKWVRSLKEQCDEAEVPFLFKQWGGPKHDSGGRLLDGEQFEAYPRIKKGQPKLL